MKEKRLYQSPTTRRDVVELEDGFCGSITNDAGEGVAVTSKTQEYGAFDAMDEFQKTDDNSAIKWE